MATQWPFRDLFEDMPELGFYTQLYGQYRPQSRQAQYFGNQYGDIRNEYYGSLGQTVRGGGWPDLRWEDFLRSFPFTERYAGLPPQVRGMGEGRFNPMTRWFT